MSGGSSPVDDELTAVRRFRLPLLDREMLDLGYMDPRAEGFGVNLLTELIDCPSEERTTTMPVLTFYARPADANYDIDLTKARQWLEPNNHRYEPLANLLFVPSSQRTITDGYLCTTPLRPGRIGRYLAVRRSGSVELAPNGVWWRESPGCWMIDSKVIVAQFQQLLRFLVAFAERFFEPPAWTVSVNIRNAAGSYLSNFGRGWANPFEFPGQTTTALERHAQFEVSFSGTAADIDELGRQMATRLEFVFGFDQPRVYNRTDPIGVLEMNTGY